MCFLVGSVSMAAWLTALFALRHVYRRAFSMTWRVRITRLDDARAKRTLWPARAGARRGSNSALRTDGLPEHDFWRCSVGSNPGMPLPAG